MICTDRTNGQILADLRIKLVVFQAIGMKMKLAEWAGAAKLQSSVSGI